MKFFLILFLVTSGGVCMGQNLVINPSFEDTTSCPFSASQIQKAFPWFQPSINSSSSDLFNPCSVPTNVGVPYNFSGFQNPRTAHGYAGIYLNVDTLNIREYIQGQLVSPLLAGKIYCVSFYVSLSDTSSQAISRAGAYFSQDSLLYFGYQAITSVIPQVENSGTNFLISKTEWMEVSGYFIATGGERFVTIGNFNAPLNSPFQNVSSGFYPSSYYYIDDVSVINCDSLQSIIRLGVEDKISVVPNPNNGSFRLQYAGIITKPLTLSITDVYGKLTDKVEIKNQTTNYENTSLMNGLYFYSLRNGDEEVGRGKILVVK